MDSLAFSKQRFREPWYTQSYISELQHTQTHHAILSSNGKEKGRTKKKEKKEEKQQLKE